MSGNISMDISRYQRLGRGKYVEVDLPVSALASILQSEAKRRNADWKLIACQKVRSNGHYRQLTETLSIEQLAFYVDKGVWQYFLWSPKVSPEAGALCENGADESTLSTLGLVNIQCGRKNRAGVARTAVSIVDKVMDTVSGLIVEHRDYLEIFRIIKRAFQKAQENVQTGLRGSSGLSM